MAPAEDANDEVKAEDSAAVDAQRVQKTGVKGRLTRAWRLIWRKPNLDLITLITISKGALAPVVALAIFQSTAVANLFPTQGYLFGIVALYGNCHLPQAKFVQTMTLNVLSVCLSTAFGLLASWSAVRARETTPSSPPSKSNPAGYNSSQSVILGVWLFVQIYAVNAFRARFPQYLFPAIIWSLFTLSICTDGTQASNVSDIVDLCVSLLEAFLFALAIATGIHILIIPMTTRAAVFSELTAYFGNLRKTLQAELNYLHALADPEKCRKTVSSPNDGGSNRIPEAQAVKDSMAKVQSLHAKMFADLPFAQCEFAFGYLGPEHLAELFRLNRRVYVPTMGLSAVTDIFESLESFNMRTESSLYHNRESSHGTDLTSGVAESWVEYMARLADRFTSLFDLLDDGIEHIMIILKLKKTKHRPEGAIDIENAADKASPGMAAFAKAFEARLGVFKSSKDTVLRIWSEQSGTPIPDTITAVDSDPVARSLEEDKGARHPTNGLKQRQLYTLLYLEYLMNAAAEAVLTYILAVEAWRDDKTLLKRRFIVPGRKRLRRWIISWFSLHNGSHDDEHTSPDLGGNMQTVQMGPAYNARHDPEHLPPTNWLERVGETIRTVPKFLRSSQSAFGFRIACAVTSVALLAFIRQTQHWFIKERVSWALITICISTSTTAGASLFSFILRVIATVSAMFIAWLIWYIPDQKTPGILVFMWLFGALWLYVPIKRPQFITLGLYGFVTTLLFVGYQLEIRKVGIAVATSSGAPFYPIYEYAPRRLATVLAGLGISFIWIILPFPISEHSRLRKGLGSSMFLLAEYHAIVQELTRARLSAPKDDPGGGHVLVHELERQRTKVFSKLVVSLNSLRVYSNFNRFEIPVGGKFPRKAFNEIIDSMTTLFSSMSLLSYTSISFAPQSEQESVWAGEFREAFEHGALASEEITTYLSLMSANVQHGQPLPARLRLPQPYQISERMDRFNGGVLSARHVREPAYAAFAVVQISTRCIIKDLDSILENVKSLVGELDFSFSRARGPLDARFGPIISNRGKAEDSAGPKRD